MDIINRGFVFLRTNGPVALVRHIAAFPKYRWELFKAQSRIFFKNNRVKIRGNAVRVNQNGVVVNLRIQQDPINTIGLVFENFLYEEYKQLNPKGRNIIDIGASIADTPLYFAARGARHVYGYEISKVRQSEARTNLALNPELAKKITYINQGVNAQKLNALVSKIGICSIKIDCDNPKLERDLIKGLQKGGKLNKIDELIMEYSDGCEPMNKILVDSDFEVSVPPITGYGNGGILFAKHR